MSVLHGLLAAVLAASSSSEEGGTAETIVGFLAMAATAAYFIKRRVDRPKREAAAEAERQALLSSPPRTATGGKPPRAWQPDPLKPGRYRLWTGSNWSAQLTFNPEIPLPLAASDRPVKPGPAPKREGDLQRRFREANTPAAPLTGRPAAFARWWSAPGPLQIPRLPTIERGPFVVATLFTVIQRTIFIADNGVRDQGGWLVTALAVVITTLLMWAMILVCATYAGRYWRLLVKGAGGIFAGAILLIIVIGLLVALYYAAVFLIALIMVIILAAIGLTIRSAL